MSFRKRWHALFGATLDLWVHSILYIRHVYPREAFTSTRFLGIRCHVCRHPAVVQYIKDALSVAIPSIFQKVADEVYLAITDEKLSSTVDVERYRLNVLDILSDLPTVDEDSHLIELLERSMRDMLLRVHSLESDRASYSDSLSFKIQLHIPKENKSCEEINYAFATGSWTGVDIEADAFVRGQYELSTPLCNIEFSWEETQPRNDQKREAA